MIYVNNDSENYQDVYVPRTVIVTGGTNQPFDPSDYWTSARTEEYVEEQLSDYTPTNDFATINGEPITEGGDISVSPSYSAGTNIDISNNTISVTGITVPTKVSDLNNDTGFITSDALTGYAQSTAVTQEINNAVSGLAESSAVTQEITNALTAYTPTSGFSTINGNAITNGGDITISGGSGAAAIEMTQAEYNALSGNVSADTFYIITDASPIDVSDFATTGTVSTLSGEVADKADKQNVNANISSYQFPSWNNQGVITGVVATKYQNTNNVNGSYYYLVGNNSNGFTVYGPQTTGNNGELCVSNGSGAPIWKTILAALGVDFWVGSQDDYDDMPSHSNTTLYIIDPDL